jgi:HEAT repeat protein
MDATLQRLLELTREGTVERRCAALLVLGALQSQESGVVEAAGAVLGQANVVLRDYALRYFEDARPKAGIPLLLPLLEDGDADIQERAVRLLAYFGQTAIRPLLQQAKAASRSWQLNAARVLSAIRGRLAWKGLLQLLPQGDTEFDRTVCDLVIATLREMSEKEQEELYSELETFAAALDEKTQRPALISTLRLCGQLGRPQTRKWLIGFVGADHHPGVRSHALVALLRCLRGQTLQKGEFARLLPILEEPEFSDAVRLVLDLLEAHVLPEEYQPLLARLVDSPHIAVQKFALRKMGEFDSPAVVRALVQQLGDPDAARRDAAARSLQKMASARTLLTKEFLACDDARKAWAIAEILPLYEGKWRRDTLDAMWARLQTAITHEDRAQGAYLYFLKSVDVEYAYSQLAIHGAQLLRKNNYREAVKFLSRLKEFPTFQAEDKYRLALAQLKLHPHAVESLARRHEPVLELFTDLYRSSAFPLLESLKKEKILEPEDLFYLGFHFVESSVDERELGKDLLAFLTSRYPRTTVGKSAKNKLKLLAA